MKQLTIRGFDPELAREIRSLAEREGISLNQAVLRLLRRAAGLGAGPDCPAKVGAALDAFIGTWTAEEARDLLQSIEACEQVDPEFWH